MREQPYFPYKPPEMKVLYFLAFIFGLIAVISLSIYYYTEFLWFDSVGYGDVFLTYLKYSIAFFFLEFLIFFIPLTVSNLAIRKVTLEFHGEPLKIPHLLDFVIALFAALTVKNYWISMLFYLNSTDFGIPDPIFGFDASFYTFQLPFLKLLLGSLLGAVLISLTISVFAYIYAFRWVKSLEEFSEIFPGSGFVHLSILVFALFLFSASLIFLSRFEIVYSEHGLISGASYVEVNVLSPSLTILSAIVLISGILAGYLIAKRNFERVLQITAVLFVVAVLLTFVAPFIVQKFIVEPSELSYEEKYIAYSINYTLFAYNLHDVKLQKVDYSKVLNYSDIIAAKETIDNIRIWDHRPILDVFRQLQQIRTYYVIKDVDVDRYRIDNSYVQLMLAARELSIENLPSKAQTWLNRHLIYTHGYGIVASPVNKISKEGLPEFYIYDIPPEGLIKIERPEIYYGELTNEYVVVNTLQEEFDYPKGDLNFFTRYAGDGGIKLDYFKRVLFSFRFGDVNLILSNYITDESRLMMHRNIVDRVSTIMPFFVYDDDPYVAVINGEIWWIIDAYSTLQNFPYSAKIGGFNYMQNPVKVFINAYNGSVRFYVVQEDAYVRVLEKALPGVFLKEMPKEFREHIRYPRDYFRVQAQIYSTYHMKDVTAFYNREDVWAVAKEKYENSIVEVEPYYVTLAIEDEPEFVLILPLTPINRDNMIAWMAARCDEKYGELIIYEFPKGELIYGPMQIEARIDQDPELSKLFTLWNQAGSRVIRGNLLVVPINNSVIYVEPVYLRGESAKIPELRLVIVVQGDDLATGTNLYEALEVLKARKPEKPVETEEQKLEVLKEYYRKLLDAAKVGDWETFGEMLKKIGEVLGYGQE
uniref:UPF0182 protein ENR21_06650 n=1 Tax=Archaeoglobus fulgidus TaxID=2234 RepID=A0A7C3VKS7_ARCFL